MLDIVLAQMMVGLSQGAFYAMLSLGLAIIFGMLNVINFAHGAFYTMGAFGALIGYSSLPQWLGDESFRLGFWPALLAVPLLVGLFGILIEGLLLRRLYKLDHIFSLLLTFGVALILQGIFANYFNISGTPYNGTPGVLDGIFDLGFMVFPKYRVFAIVVALLLCAATWFSIEHTRWGAVMRASTENSELVQALGINVPLMMTLTFGFGAALAAVAGVVAAPIYSVSPLMGAELIITVFAVVVIGGMGSVGGAIFTGLALGLIQGLVKALCPPAANTVIFIIMAIVLLARPSGLFGKE